MKLFNIKSWLIWGVVIMLLVGSNVATVYIYGLIDEASDLRVANTNLESKVDQLLEENMQLQVNLQVVSEPSNEPLKK